MGMKAYHYTEVEEQAVEGALGVTIRWVIGDNVSAPNFATRIIAVKPGSSTEYHQHPWEHEVYLLEGSATVKHKGGETEVGPGSCIYVEPNEIHCFENRGDSLARFICVIPKPS